MRKIRSVLHVVPFLKSSALLRLSGPETVSNTLLYNQYGIMALSGGWLKYGVLDMMRNTLNKKLDLTTSFAAWRIDPPYKPRTKKGVGKRMGKGKGAIDHYVTPVRAGRILLEVGGKLDYQEIEPVLQVRHTFHRVAVVRRKRICLSHLI